MLGNDSQLADDLLGEPDGAVLGLRLLHGRPRGSRCGLAALAVACGTAGAATAGRAAGAADRRPLSGSYDEVRADLATLAEQGVDEVFVDLNFDPEIGSVDADPAESVRRAHEVLTELAP